MKKLLLTLLVAASASAQTRVWIVAPAGGDFTDLQPAIDAAAQQDTVLVRSVPGGPAHFGPALIDNKSLNLVVENGSTAITSGLSIRNTGGGRPVLVDGLTVEGRLLVANCDGTVRLTRLTAYHPTPQPDEFHDRATHRILTSDDVTLNECHLTGRHGEGATWAGDGEAGLRIENSKASLYDSHVRGGTGGYAWGSAFCIGSGEGDGGDGLQVRGTASVRFMATTLEGGPMGDHPCGPTYGFDGDDTVVDGTASLDEHTHPALILTATAHTVGGTPASISIQGEPGAAVFLLASPDPWRRALPLDLGTLHLQSPLTVIPLGTLGPGGIMHTSFSTTQTPPGVDFELYRLQLFGSVPGERYLSNPQEVLALAQ